MKVLNFFYLVVIAILISVNSVFAKNDKNILIVALDGSGDYKSIQQAITACGAFSSTQKMDLQQIVGQIF